MGGAVEAGGHRFRVTSAAAGAATLAWVPPGGSRNEADPATYTLQVPAAAAPGAVRPAASGRVTRLSRAGADDPNPPTERRP